MERKSLVWSRQRRSCGAGPCGACKRPRWLWTYGTARLCATCRRVAMWDARQRGSGGAAQRSRPQSRQSGEDGMDGGASD